MEKIKTTEGGQDKVHYCWKKDIDEAREEALEEGRKAGLLEAAETMLKDGMPLDKVSFYSWLTVPELNAMAEQNTGGNP